MATTKAEIREWLIQAKKEKATHLIVVCDTFSYEDYPVSVLHGENVREKLKKYDNSNMQSVMEVYDLNLDIEKQLNEDRAYHV